MSLVNLLSSFFCPTYSSKFVVDNEDLQKLRDRIALEHQESSYYVDGVVGKFLAGSMDDSVTERTARSRIGSRMLTVHLVLLCLLTATHFGLVGALSGFREQESIDLQRVVTMAWFSTSLLAGVVMAANFSHSSDQNSELLVRRCFREMAISWIFIVTGVALWELPIVGMMILKGRICENI